MKLCKINVSMYIKNPQKSSKKSAIWPIFIYLVSAEIRWQQISFWISQHGEKWRFLLKISGGKREKVHPHRRLMMPLFYSKDSMMQSDWIRFWFHFVFTIYPGFVETIGKMLFYTRSLLCFFMLILVYSDGVEFEELLRFNSKAFNKS